ncbi:hypothetical protein ABZ383_32515 [Streptomyces sp. NPDC005900]|uniref:hypothetical protein n=1 Tax=Streptomyces sp. NPDC005900 TaxID=3154569 RepID=UPI0033EC8F52
MARRIGMTKTLSNIIEDLKERLDDTLDSLSDLEHDTRTSLSRAVRPSRDRERVTERGAPPAEEAPASQTEMAILLTRLGQIEELLRQQQHSSQPAQGTPKQS